jgi:hypothetical protein
MNRKSFLVGLAVFVIMALVCTSCENPTDVSKPGTVETPTANPGAGTYSETQTVSLATTTEGATIYYTLDGTTPSASNGMAYTAAIPISVSTTLKAIAVKDGWNDSGILTASYTLAESNPFAGTWVAPVGSGITIEIEESTWNITIGLPVEGFGMRGSYAINTGTATFTINAVKDESNEWTDEVPDEYKTVYGVETLPGTLFTATVSEDSLVTTSEDAGTFTNVRVAENILPEGYENFDTDEWYAWLEESMGDKPDESSGFTTLVLYMQTHLDDLTQEGRAVWQWIIGTNAVVQETDTTIGGVAYTDKAENGGNSGTHYKLSVSYDEALVAFTDLFGFPPSDGYDIQNGSTLSAGADDWVIFEDDRREGKGSYRLVKKEDGTSTGVGWNKRQKYSH